MRETIMHTLSPYHWMSELQSSRSTLCPKRVSAYDINTKYAKPGEDILFAKCHQEHLCRRLKRMNSYENYLLGEALSLGRISSYFALQSTIQPLHTSKSTPDSFTLGKPPYSQRSTRIPPIQAYFHRYEKFRSNHSLKRAFGPIDDGFCIRSR